MSKKTPNMNQMIARQRVRATGWQRVRVFFRRARLVAICAVVLAVCLLVTGGLALTGKLFYLFVARSGYFELTRVEMRGVGPEAGEELIELTGLKVRSGVNLLSVRNEAIRRIVQNHPKIRSAEVRKRYPRTIVITAEERQPVATLSSHGFYPIDEVATVLGRADIKALDEPLPFVTGVSDEDIIPGKRLRSPQIREALDLMSALKELKPDIYRDLSELNVSETEGLVAYLKGGVEIRFGRDPVQTLPALDLFLLSHKDLDRCDYVDLRFENKVVYQPRESAGR